MAGKKSWPKFTDSLYSSMLAAWMEKPTVSFVMEQLDLPRSLVNYVRDHGMPEIDRPSLQYVTNPNNTSQVPSGPGRPSNKLSKDVVDGEAVAAQHLIIYEDVQRHAEAIRSRLMDVASQSSDLAQKADLAEQQQEVDGTITVIDDASKELAYEAKRIATVEHRAIAAHNIKRSAEEAAIARQALNTCLSLGAIYSHCADAYLVAIEEGRVALPAVVDMRVLNSLATSVDRMTAAMERAVKIEKGRSGETEKTPGVQIGILLDKCSDAELDMIVANGRFPDRLKLMIGSGDNNE